MDPTEPTGSTKGPESGVEVDSVITVGAHDGAGEASESALLLVGVSLELEEVQDGGEQKELDEDEAMRKWGGRTHAKSHLRATGMCMCRAMSMCAMALPQCLFILSGPPSRPGQGSPEHNNASSSLTCAPISELKDPIRSKHFDIYYAAQLDCQKLSHIKPEDKEV